MTWRQLEEWIWEELDRWDMRPLREELSEDFLQREAADRARVDDWIESHYLQERCPPPDEDMRRWVCLRLVMASMWLTPLAHSSLRDQEIDLPEWQRLLLIEMWPALGVPRLRESVLAPSADTDESG